MHRQEDHEIGIGRALLVALALSTLIACGGAETPPEPEAEKPVEQAQVLPVKAGEPFPAGVFNNLNAEQGGPASVDLAHAIGKKPIILYYWIAGNGRSEEVLQELQELMGELGDERIAFYAVAVPRPDSGPDVIRKRIRELGIRFPVLEDTGFEIGRRLQIQKVPNITIVDREGLLQVTNGASLAQDLKAGLDIETAIRLTAESGSVETFGMLGRYFPVTELEGENCPDFRAPFITSNIEQRWHRLMDPEKLNVLIFWSVDCPHCRKSLPQINTWLMQNPDEVNVLSAATVTNDVARTKTRQFCELNGFVFPTFEDKNSEIGKLFRITSTPTIVIIGPDGVIDSAIVTDSERFAETIEEKKRQLLATVES